MNKTKNKNRKKEIGTQLIEDVLKHTEINIHADPQFIDRLESIISQLEQNENVTVYNNERLVYRRNWPAIINKLLYLTSMKKLLGMIAVIAIAIGVLTVYKDYSPKKSTQKIAQTPTPVVKVYSKQELSNKDVEELNEELDRNLKEIDKTLDEYDDLNKELEELDKTLAELENLD